MSNTVEQQTQDNPAQKTSKLPKLPHNSHIIVKGLIVVAIFFLGFNFGSGRLHLQKTSSENKNLPTNLSYGSVEQVYDALKENYDGKLDEIKLLDGLKAGLAQATGDPYTEYQNQEDSKAFNEQLTGTFTGIGAELGKDKDNIVIIAPISGFPADKAGLRPKDIIIAIDGKSTAGLSIDDAVKRIRGPKDTKVTLKVLRDDSQQLTFDITRDNITLPSVESKTLDGNIGYIKVSRFGDDTSQLSREAATKFKQANVNGVILDLRGDPGGLLESAVDVSSLWLEDKTVLQEKRDGTLEKTYASRGDAILAGVPTIVLIDEGSASASEITAGALHDNKAATLMGVKSYGKGSVQQLLDLPDGGVLKVTVARWYTPNGKNIDKAGITPDKEVKLTDDDYKNHRDPQLDAALVQLRK